ncbi:unnamed protein product [Linum tenue]|uniref:GATA transcription factor 28 n=1 Tax=Linum tenue TaxID=586396 RepID=A0AAV0JJH4_9ROSI|nr:unnamed protein product [Linum tenue]
MDGSHETDPGMQMGGAENELNIHYEHYHHHHEVHGMSNGSLMNDGEEGNDCHDNNGNGSDTMPEVEVDQGNLSDSQVMMVADPSIENGDQLTLSFQGQVYVFDSVSPEKVQAVLLLLGGREVPLGASALPMTSPQGSKGMSATPERFSVPQRLASLLRFREKRKERNFDKKIRYTVRKEVALRMQRHKGQFTSSKGNNDDSVTSWGSSESCGSDSNGSKHQEAVCRHCGTSEKSTPMMRRGPEGPRTLCNACGLMWANKGTLRDLSKSAPQVGQSTSALNRNPEVSETLLKRGKLGRSRPAKGVLEIPVRQ